MVEANERSTSRRRVGEPERCAADRVRRAARRRALRSSRAGPAHPAPNKRIPSVIVPAGTSSLHPASVPDERVRRRRSQRSRSCAAASARRAAPPLSTLRPVHAKCDGWRVRQPFFVETISSVRTQRRANAESGDNVTCIDALDDERSCSSSARNVASADLASCGEGTVTPETFDDESTQRPLAKRT